MEPILICDGKYKLKHPSEIKEWTDNITSWPEVTYGNIYNYLIKAPGYDHEQLEAYKSLEAYNNFMSGHVETVFFTQITSKSPYCYLKAKVKRSQKVTRAPRQPWILVRRDSGAIITAQCDCEAGLGGVCSHVAAVLFKVECAVRMGLLQKAPTERGCEWNNNFSKKVSPAAINDIQFIKHKYGKKSRERRYRQPLQPVPPSEAAIKELHALLPEAVYFTTCDKVDAESTDTASEGEDDTDGLPVLLTSITTAESFGRYHITKAQAEQLATSTSRQAESPLWKAHRKGRITASLVHKIITRKSTTPPNVLVSEVMGESSFDGMRVEATRWGLIHEAEAIQLYKSDTSHMNMKLHRPGLIVDHELPFFGATPDGLFTCDCHGNGVLEVKCPFKYRDEYPENLAGLDNFILDVNMNVVTSHKYFSQVQFQMQLCHATVCDLVIWTKHGLLQIQVAHDATYCSTMLQKATAFFTEAVLPALTSQSQPPSVSSAQTPSVSSAQTPSVSSVSSAKEPAKNHNSVDKDTVLYCLCREPEHGNMIACDNDSCAIEWFHYNCVDITTPPRGRWFCPDCNDC